MPHKTRLSAYYLRRIRFRQASVRRSFWFLIRIGSDDAEQVDNSLDHFRRSVDFEIDAVGAFNSQLNACRPAQVVRAFDDMADVVSPIVAFVFDMPCVVQI